MTEGSLKLPAYGLVFSLALTLGAYAAVTGHWLSGRTLAAAILGLALAQLIVQMTCFLDLGFGAGSRWRLLTFAATVGLVAVIVIGSIWIMAHLNYSMMASPDAMREYIESQQGF